MCVWGGVRVVMCGVVVVIVVACTSLIVSMCLYVRAVVLSYMCGCDGVCACVYLCACG